MLFATAYWQIVVLNLLNKIFNSELTNTNKPLSLFLSIKILIPKKMLAICKNRSIQ